MVAQSFTLAPATYLARSEDSAGTIFQSKFVASAWYASHPITGAIGSSAKPILITNFVINGKSGASNNYLPTTVTFADSLVYYGFSKTSISIAYFNRGVGATNYQGIFKADGTTKWLPDTTPSWSTYSISAVMGWSHSPNEPTNVSATISEANASVTLTWTAPSDIGGQAVSGYRVLYKVRNTATDAVPSSWTVLTTGATNGTNISKGIVAGTTAVVSGLTPGAVYDFRVAALNLVTQYHNGGDATTVGTYTSPSAHTGTNASRNNVTLAGAPVFIFDNMPTFEVFGQLYVGVAEARFPTPELSGLNFTYTVLTTGFTIPTGYTPGRPAGTTLTSTGGVATLTGTLTDTTVKNYIFTIRATESSTGATVTSDPFIVRVQNSRLQSRDAGTFARRNTRVRVGGAWLVAGVRVYDSTYTAPWDGSQWRPLE